MIKKILLAFILFSSLIGCTENPYNPLGVYGSHPINAYYANLLPDAYAANLNACLTDSPSCNYGLLNEQDRLRAVNIDTPVTHVYHSTPAVSRQPVPAQTINHALSSSSAPQPKTVTHKSAPPECTETSCYGDISRITGRPRTHYVHGYYRKDGTYVRSYYRS